MTQLRSKTIAFDTKEDFTNPVVETFVLESANYINFKNIGINQIEFEFENSGDKGVLIPGEKAREFFSFNDLIDDKINFTFVGPSILDIDWVEGEVSVSDEIEYQNSNLLTGADYSTTRAEVRTDAESANMAYLLRSIRAKEDITIFLEYINYRLDDIGNTQSATICVLLNPSIDGIVEYFDLQVLGLEEGGIDTAAPNANIVIDGIPIFAFEMDKSHGATLFAKRKFELSKGDEIVLVVNGRDQSITGTGSIGYSVEK